MALNVVLYFDCCFAIFIELDFYRITHLKKRNRYRFSFFSLMVCAIKAGCHLGKDFFYGFFELFLLPIRISNKVHRNWTMTKKVTKPNLQPKKTIASSWIHFCKRYPDERSCSVFTRKHFSKDEKFDCSLCGFQNHVSNFESRTFKCVNCKKKIWILSGTFFERVRRFLPWLAAIWFIEDGVVISAAEFARLVGVATSTALAIFKKLSVVIESKMQKDFQEIPSVMFVKTFFRRSRVTPAGKHPREEENAAVRESGRKSQRTLHAVPPPRKDRCPRAVLSRKEVELLDSLIGEKEKCILSILSDRPTSFDNLCAQTDLSVSQISAALINMELFEMIKRLPGDNYVSGAFADQTPSQSLQSDSPYRVKESIAARFIDFIARHYGGISRKYLQNYVSLFWAYEDKKRWKKGTILHACVGFREVTDDDLLFYVTPVAVSAPAMLAS